MMLQLFFFLIKDIADAFSSILVYNQPDKKMSLCFLNGANLYFNINDIHGH